MSLKIIQKTAEKASTLIFCSSFLLLFQEEEEKRRGWAEAWAFLGLLCQQAVTGHKERCRLHSSRKQPLRRASWKHGHRGKPGYFFFSFSPIWQAGRLPLCLCLSSRVNSEANVLSAELCFIQSRQCTQILLSLPANRAPASCAGKEGRLLQVGWIFLRQNFVLRVGLETL